jgi:GWxTD domain-containing protein
MMPMSRSPFLTALILLVAVSAVAEDAVRFGDGPAKWLMTSAEQRAWKAVKTPQQERDFEDLFWARRDPTPGTFANEFELNFISRVAFADKRYGEKKKRGSMTDRGRALVALGFPSNISEAAAKYQKQESAGGNDITGGHRLSGRDVWLWNHEDAVRNFGLPKVEIVFIIDSDMGTSHRDTERNDFLNALPVAIQRAIVNPDLTEVPEWARSQGARRPSDVALRTIHEGDNLGTTVLTIVPTAAPSAAPVALPKSAGKLTLLHDAFAVEAQTGKDPFAAMTPVESFKSGEDLGFVAEYCAGVILEELSGVTVQAKITGVVNNEKINMTGPVEDLVPDSIRSSPGCHLVRGSLSLEGVDPGQYSLTLTVAAGSDSYNLTRDFHVE